jgi:hypothetical protein
MTKERQKGLWVLGITLAIVALLFLGLQAVTNNRKLASLTAEADFIEKDISLTVGGGDPLQSFRVVGAFYKADIVVDDPTIIRVSCSGNSSSSNGGKLHCAIPVGTYHTQPTVVNLNALKRGYTDVKISGSAMDSPNLIIK